MKTARTCRQCLGRLSTTPASKTIWRSKSSTSRRSTETPTSPQTSSTPRKSSILLPQTAKRNVSFGSQQPSETKKDDYYVTSLGHATPNTERALLQPNNLFHSFSNSPSPEIRRRAAFMKQHAYCPHPSHQRTRIPSTPLDTEARKPAPDDPQASASPPAHVRFECPDCGIPVACCQEHWEDDYESHLEVCDTLQQINEDDHDLRSGRFFHEFEYPEGQRAEEFVLNMSNWDTFLYTRDFNAIDDARSMRQVTRLLTYPTTIASVLHELSPYSIKKGGRLTPEGLRSFSGKHILVVDCRRSMLILLLLQLCDIPYIHRPWVKVIPWHHCVLSLLLSVYSSSVHEPSPLFPARSGSSSPTAFHAHHSTSSSSVRRQWPTENANSHYHQEPRSTHSEVSWKTVLLKTSRSRLL